MLLLLFIGLSGTSICCEEGLFLSLTRCTCALNFTLLPAYLIILLMQVTIHTTQSFISLMHPSLVTVKLDSHQHRAGYMVSHYCYNILNNYMKIGIEVQKVRGNNVREEHILYGLSLSAVV